jgi:hypothetical protein
LAVDDDIEFEVEQGVEADGGAFFLTDGGGDLRALAALLPPVREPNEESGVFKGGDVAEEFVGFRRGPGERVEDIAGLDERGHERAGFSGSVERGEELEEGGFVFRSGVFLKGFAERNLVEAAGL